MNKLIIKYRNLSATTKATFWFTLCNFILKGISFITVPIFTNVLSTEEFGIVSVFNSYQQLLLIFATFELPLGAYQRGLLRYKNDVGTFTKSIQLLCSLITFGLFIIIFFFRNLFITLTNTSITILTLMFVHFLLEPAYDCWINKKRFDYDYRKAVVFTILYTVLSTVGSLMAVILIGHTATVRIVSMLIIQILFCLPFYIKNIDFSILQKASTVKEQLSFALRFQLPLVVHSLSFLILAQSDRMMIGRMVGNSEAALYSVAYSLANVIILFQTGFNYALKPWRYKKLEEKSYKSIGTNTYSLLFLIGTLIFAFILVAPEIMIVLFPKDYFEAVWTIPPISASVFFMFLYTVFTDVESYFGKTKYIMYASLTCAILNVILNYFGIIYFGYIACGYTTLFSYVMFSLLHYLFTRHILKTDNIPEFFDSKLLLRICAGFIVLVIACLFLYVHTIIRYSVIVIGIVLIIIFRKKISALFHKVLMRKKY